MNDFLSSINLDQDKAGTGVSNADEEVENRGARPVNLSWNLSASLTKQPNETT